jgi:hypothetical protein
MLGGHRISRARRGRGVKVVALIPLLLGFIGSAPASAQTIYLHCVTDDGEGEWDLSVDTANSTLQMSNIGLGTVPYRIPAQISSTEITTSGPNYWKINRLTGRAIYRYSRTSGYVYTCRKLEGKAIP